MGTAAERNLWYKGKADIMGEYEKNSRLILSTVASRNFSGLPGFAIAALTDIELDSKLKLTEYNQKIFSDSIEREMKSLGIDYDKAIKDQMILWESRKQTILLELQSQFSDLEQLREIQAEDYVRLMIAQEVREIAISIEKVAIENQIIGVRQSIGEADDILILPSQQLAAAQKYAAEKKLTAIPYILAALASQREALDQELLVIIPARTAKANIDVQLSDQLESTILPLLASKAAATEAYSNKQGELIPYVLERARASQSYATAVIAQLASHIGLAREKVNLANARVERATKEVTIAQKEIELDTKKIQIELARSELELARAEAKVALAEAMRVQLGLVDTAMTNESAAELQRIIAVAANELTVKMSQINVVEAKRIEVEGAELTKQASVVRAIGSMEHIHQTIMANQASDARISETLIHMLSA